MCESCSVVSDSLRPHELYSPRNSPGQNTRVGSCSLLQRIFPTQGSNPGLSHCRRILYLLSPQGSHQEDTMQNFSVWKELGKTDPFSREKTVSEDWPLDEPLDKLADNTLKQFLLTLLKKAKKYMIKINKNVWNLSRETETIKKPSGMPRGGK